MGWFKRRCPLEKLVNRELGKDKCDTCYYWRDGECSYKKIVAEELSNSMRGLGVLAKQAAMEARKKGIINEESAARMEMEALRLSTLRDKGSQREYWEISKAYDEEWQVANPEERVELEWRMHHWQRFMEDGFSPKEADEKARQLNYHFWRGLSHKGEDT